MKRIARDFTVTMEVPNDIPIGHCEITIKVESATYSVAKKGLAGIVVKSCTDSKNVHVDYGQYYQEVKV